MKRNPILMSLAFWAGAWIPRAAADTNMVEAIRKDHGIALAFTGMLIVYAGLAGICLFIMVLPKLMALSKRLPFKVKGGHGHAGSASRVPASEELDGETLAAIALVLHTEAERFLGQDPKVTIGLSSAFSSPWALSSKMRSLPSRIKTL